MSSTVANIAPVLVPEQAGGEAVPGRVPARKRVRPYKARMATKVKQALEESMQRSVAQRRRMRKVLAKLEEIQALFDGYDRLSGGSYDLLVRVYTQIGKLEHELLGLSLEVAENEQIIVTAIAESRPETKK